MQDSESKDDHAAQLTTPVLCCTSLRINSMASPSTLL
jgi:hypothetical protein